MRATIPTGFACIACAAIMFVSCSTPKEEVRAVTPPVETPKVAAPSTERVFTFEDRYYVRGASIASSTNIEDPVQALRVIQIKPGTNDVLIISSFGKDLINGKEIATETWFGVELPSFAPGTYDVSRATDVKYYRFDLGKTGLRYDGQSFTGTVIVEKYEEGYLVGSVDVVVQGKTKSFEESSQPFTQKLVGSFRIKEVPVDATLIKSR